MHKQHVIHAALLLALPPLSLSPYWCPFSLYCLITVVVSVAHSVELLTLRVLFRVPFVLIKNYLKCFNTKVLQNWCRMSEKETQLEREWEREGEVWWRTWCVSDVKANSIKKYAYSESKSTINMEQPLNVRNTNRKALPLSRFYVFMILILFLLCHEILVRKTWKWTTIFKTVQIFMCFFPVVVILLLCFRSVYSLPM